VAAAKNDNAMTNHQIRQEHQMTKGYANFFLYHFLSLPVLCAFVLWMGAPEWAGLALLFVEGIAFVGLVLAETQLFTLRKITPKD